ncbi:MAG: general secretion pathway protein GspB, partial [Candidatus Eisenbacteria bacterium]|nr:general secretion pathway protein GspB [Candidatus Eisenbacteria bacterium]
KAEGPAKVVATTLPKMWLSGIIWDPQNPVVMIDGLDLHVGDKIKGARVVEIRIDSVVLSFASKQYVLTVE